MTGSQQPTASSQQPGRPITVLLPSIHGRPTGGNVYNEQILSHLPVPAEAVVYNPTTDAVPVLPLGAVAVVDSLLTQHPGALRSLRDRHPSARLVLLVHYLHLGDPQGEVEARRRERALLPLFDGFVVTSTYTQAVLVREGIPPAAVAVVWPGLGDAFRQAVPKRAARAEPRLLTVANHLPGKGLVEFVEVLEALAEAAWTWTLIGDGVLDPAYSERLRARVARSPLAERITLAPPRMDAALIEAYDAADVFVLPSRFETLSMVTREAMARALPVVAYDVGGLRDSITRPEVGHLVPPGDRQALAEAVQGLIQDAEQRKRIGTEARQASLRFPDWTAAARKLHDFLREEG